MNSNRHLIVLLKKHLSEGIRETNLGKEYWLCDKPFISDEMELINRYAYCWNRTIKIREQRMYMKDRDELIKQINIDLSNNPGDPIELCTAFKFIPWHQHWFVKLLGIIGVVLAAVASIMKILPKFYS